MKNYFSLVVLAFSLCFVSVMDAQVKTPSASPFCKIDQSVGLTDVTIEYSRPSVKDRTIFAADGLVPFGKLWRTGANAVTKFTFSKDVMIQGNELAAGSYAFLTTPGKDMWKVHFFPYEKGSWSSYKEATPAAEFMTKPAYMPEGIVVESFMIMLNQLKNDGAVVELLWDNVNIMFDVKVDTDTEVMSSIDKVMAGPSAGDYYSAASYYFDEKKDMNKALTWIQKATNVAEPKFWQVRKEALILAEMGKTKEAITAAKKSLELAQKAENADYVRMNEKSIAEWSKM